MIEHQLCKEYPALTPLNIEDMRFGTVIRLYSDVRSVQLREKELSDPDRVIRRPATSWF